ncbi:MAG: carbonic anhydrase family protein [Saprospiraceae bacterium]|nr:carbonic anhydrase family protein [Saprospiraceae bacterium]
MKASVYSFTPFTLMCLFLGSIVFFPSCKDDDKIPESCDGIHWEYEGEDGPSHWGELCVGYEDCSGATQSPVDIKGAVADAALQAIAKAYATSKTNILNNGHTIQFNYDSGSSITVNGLQYDLLQFHFHTHSEHLVNGSSHPMEVHLVHKNAASGNLAVIGVFFEEGAENALLAHYLEHLPAGHDETYTSDDTYTAADLLPAGTGYYTYSGSLTTPPCSEIVTWIVMKDHITASHDQILHIEELEHENFRPVQELAGRTIKSFN